MENPRTTAARDHDDSDMIDSIEPGAGQQGRSGGNLATDVASESELDAVQDPANHERVTKQRDIDHGTEVRPDRGANR